MAVIVSVAVLTWIALFGANLYLIDKMPGTSLADGMMTSTGPAGEAGDNPWTCGTEPYPTLLPGPGAAGVRTLPGTVYAFVPYDPDTTHASLAAGCRRIDVLLAEWYEIDAPEAGMIALDREAQHQRLITEIIARQGGLMRPVPVVRLTPRALSADATTRAGLVAAVAAAARAETAREICLWPAGTGSEHAAGLAAFVAEAEAALDAVGVGSCVIVTPHLVEDPAPLAAADKVVLKAFQEPWIGDPPGPLAGLDWFRFLIRHATDTIGRDRLVVMLGSFAVDWSTTAAAPEVLSFADALRRAGLPGARLDFPAAAGNLRLRFTDGTGVAHEVWALDAASLYTQLATLADHGVRAGGVWALGYEDPSIWPLLGARRITPEIAARLIARVDPGDFATYEGAGAFHRLVAPAQVGNRAVTFDPITGLIVDQGFSPLPQPWALERFGAGAPGDVVLTFDDGPNPVYTAQILDVLKEREAKAAFFVVGAQVMRSPDLVRRMVDEGHEVGSHTFLHPQIESVSRTRTMMELNALQRLLAVVTDRWTALFRTPYGRADGPTTGPDAAPMATLEAGGYLVVGSDVVPPDWRDLDAGEIVDFVMHRLETRGGNVIVLHDAGGDRTQTVAAVGPLIDRLRADGYRIVGLSDLLGVEREVLMPMADTSRTLLDKLSFGVLNLSGDWIAAVLLVVVAVGGLRSVVLMTLAHRRRPHPAPVAGAHVPPVSVLIPAYNEEETILRCIASVLRSDYPDLRVLVIDDGSTDHTYDRVYEAYGDDPRVWLLHEENAGKWHALDMAYDFLETEVVVAIDADSMIAPGAVSALARHFADPTVGAVAGRVQVGNRRGLLTRLQALEYLTAQSIDRRAFEHLGAMLVVPGAIGAWRAEAVRAAGLYSPQTLTEDADLTISVARAGYRVIYEEEAYAVTEAPESVGALLKQRLRWSFGMLQTAFKHLVGAARERRALGLVALPDLLFVGFGLSVLAPIADLILIGALLDLGVDRLLGRPPPIEDSRPWIIAAYVVLPVLDVVAMTLALRFDRSESRWLIALFPVQRFFYRQLLYITAWRAMFRALMGKLASWGKLARLGTARMPAGAGRKKAGA